MNTFLDFETLLLSRSPDEPIVSNTFVRTAYEPLYRLTAAIFNNSPVTERVTQQILTTALEKLNEYLPGTNFSTWLFTLAIQVGNKTKHQAFWRGLFQKAAVTPPTPETTGIESLVSSQHAVETSEVLETESNFHSRARNFGSLLPRNNEKVQSLEEKLRLPLFLAYAFELETSEIAVILHTREHIIQSRIEKALESLGWAENGTDKKKHALRAELDRAYPPPAGDGIPLGDQQPRAGPRPPRSGPNMLALSWRELAWAGVVLLTLAGIFWTSNRTDIENTTLPLFPSPTPPLPDVIFPQSASFSEQLPIEAIPSQYAVEPIISANGNVIVYMTLETPGYYLDFLDRDTGEKKRIDVPPQDSRSFVQSYLPDISDDGRWIVFAAHSTKLTSDGVPPCFPPITDCSQILLYDRETDELALVSAAPDGTPGNNNSTSPAISGDGRWVAFWSIASNLTTDDTCETSETQQNCGDLFIKDLQTGTFQRIQIGRTLFEPAEAIRPDFSQNGEWLVFPLSGNDKIEQELNLTQNSMDVVALHLPTGKIRLVNISSEGVPGNGSSYLGTISGDGRFVAFVSAASNLIEEGLEGNDPFMDNDGFLHDLETGETVQISMSLTGEQPNGPSGVYGIPLWNDRISISADGQHVVFLSYAPNMLMNANAVWCDYGGATECAGMFVYSANDGRTVQLNLQPSQVIAQREGQISFPSISADGQWIVFNATTPPGTAHCPEGTCSDIFLFNTEQTILSVSRPLPETAEETWRFQNYLEGHESRVNAVAISPDGEFLASAGQEGKVLLWNLSEERVLMTLPVSETPANALVFSPDSILAVGDQDGVVCLFTIPEGEIFRCLEAHPGQVRSLAFSPDGKQLAVAAQSVVRVWRLEDDFIHVREYPYPGGAVETIAYSPDGELLAAAVDTQIWVRQMSNDGVIARLDGQEGNIFDLAFSPDGQFLASGSMGESVLVWKIQPSGDTWRFDYWNTLVQNEWVHAVAFSPDSRLLATGLFDSSIVLWSLSDGQYYQTLRRTSQDQVIDLAFSPDGSQLASGTMRGLRLWAYGPELAAPLTDTEFFARNEESSLNTNHFMLLPTDNFKFNPEVIISFEEAQKLATIPILTPNLELSSLTLEQILVFHDPETHAETVSILYLRTTNFQPATLTITQSQLNPKTYDFPIDKFAHVTRTFVHGEDAERVTGGWNITASFFNSEGVGSFTRTWDEEIASYWLRWQENGIYISILYDQSFNQQSIANRELMTLDDLMVIAESLQ